MIVLYPEYPKHSSHLWLKSPSIIFKVLTQGSHLRKSTIQIITTIHYYILIVETNLESFQKEQIYKKKTARHSLYFKEERYDDYI